MIKGHFDLSRFAGFAQCHSIHLAKNGRIQGEAVRLRFTSLTVIRFVLQSVVARAPKGRGP